MPIVFVHGVAVRDPDDPQYAAAQRLTRGADWTVVEAALREHVAPAVRPSAPERVALIRVYWGDLGAQPTEVVEGPPLTLREVESPAALTPDELGEALQRMLFEKLPPAQWPAVVDAVWATVADPAIRAQLAARSPKRQASWLVKQVRARLVETAPELSRAFGQAGADLAAAGRRNIRWAMGGVRRPLEELVPVFVGDVLRYLDGRGVPGAPGPIVQRVLAGLAEARDAECGAGEPLVVLTHSMGGQLVYDALTAYADEVPGGMPRVDLWCASASQIGLFAELGMFVAEGPPSVVGVPADRLGYLWNAWSSSDVLSFRAEGWVAGAHDTDFTFSGSLGANHMSYLTDPTFYRTLAAKVRAHCRSAPARHGLAQYGEISD
ncbi:MAG TPA: hypothetical protein PLZ83_05855 [Dermatophilaceae bacterium]|jgi:hypothetical protein|nr:MAG: hypothetical protein BWY91_01444 [bacterium ADurb.BinA028]HNV13665.1 hypothetical protein [Dermatophilaceae bacterium]HOA03495.1 hypothetical protein [Dermatophilaceae bacterium]HOA59480.1 hypothetical protein [Dermatophilaceae bacterium]HOF36535.1 hypothetical protein [Dermatophilaceae bacterium]